MDPLTVNTVFINGQSICRFCLKIGCFKDISSEYYHCGQREVYGDMLNETFNIQINKQMNQGGLNMFICEDCITKLREAATFKSVVLQSDDNFTKYLRELQLGNDSKPGEALKVELIKTEKIDDDILCNDAEFHGDEIIPDIKTELTVKSKKRSTQKSKKKSKIEERETGQKCNRKEKAITNWSKLAEIRGNGPILRANTLKVIKNSSICVFQWHKSRYRCFCCKTPFSDMNLLRKHMESHSLENIERTIISQQNLLVKVEVSVLFCKLCESRMDSLDSLRRHLTESHAIKFELDEDLLVPFKIREENLQCQICFEFFRGFRLLNMHVNKHFQKQVCHVCGAGFPTLRALGHHKTHSHRLFHCKDCDLVFTTKILKKRHDIDVHNAKAERKLRFPCPFCQERFFQESNKVQHLIDKHGMKKPEHKCDLCPKVFITRSLRNIHMKGVHLKEKNHECEICHHFFYSKSDKARHKPTHTGEKNFSCEICNTLFATKDSLRRHLKRTHVN